MPKRKLVGIIILFLLVVLICIVLLFYLKPSKLGVSLYPDKFIKIEEITEQKFLDAEDNKIINQESSIESDGQYLNWSGESYLTASFNGPYYPIFDYGFVFRVQDFSRPPGTEYSSEGIYFFDTELKKIEKLADCHNCYDKIKIYPLKDYLILQYFDGVVDVWNGESYNKENKLVLFARNGKIRMLKKVDDTLSIDRIFWSKDEKFYFLEKSKFYSISITSDNFSSNKVFIKPNNLIENRVITGKGPLEIVNFCKNESSKIDFGFQKGSAWSDYGKKRFFADCVNQVALSNNDSSVCENIGLSDEKNDQNFHTKFRDECFHNLAIVNLNSDLCDKLSDKNGKSDCFLQIAEKTGNYDANLCDKLSGRNDKNICFLKIAEKTGDYNICYSIDTINNAQQDCFKKVAVVGLIDCNLLLSTEDKDSCFNSQAIYRNSTLLCTNLPCFISIAMKTKNLSVCKDLVNYSISHPPWHNYSVADQSNDLYNCYNAINFKS